MEDTFLITKNICIKYCTFEINTQIHPKLECIDDTCLNCLLHDSKALEGHATGTYHVVPLNQLLQQSLGSGKGLVRVQEGLHKLQI